MGKKVISFSLWGGDPNYNVGAVENAKLALSFYPEFECWFYTHKQSTPEGTITQLKAFKNTKIIFKDVPLGPCNTLYKYGFYRRLMRKVFSKYDTLDACKPMTWRFEAIDDPDVEIMLSRDTDTRILPREKLAVEEWLSSGKSFHIMRDHPYHCMGGMKIPGGMFGTKKLKDISSWKERIREYKIKTAPRGYGYDQSFLHNCIYPVIKNDVLIHSIIDKEVKGTVKAFPIAHCKDWKFVGEYVYADGSRNQDHVYMLRRYCEKSRVRCFGDRDNYTYKEGFLLKRIKEIISRQDPIPEVDILLDLHRKHFGRKLGNVRSLYVSGENIHYWSQFQVRRGLGILNKIGLGGTFLRYLLPTVNSKVEFLKNVRVVQKLNSKCCAILTNDVQGDYILRFPYFFHSFISKFDRFITVKKLYKNKSKFCAFIVGNDYAKDRIDFFHKLSKYKKVDSYGRVCNNAKISEDLIKKYKRKGVSMEQALQEKAQPFVLKFNALNQELFREYKFVICFENSYAKDYISEKLPNVMMANSIGIYRGAPNVDEFFNTDSFINYENYGCSYDAMIEKIIELDRDDEKYNAMLKKPFFVNNEFPSRIATAEKDLEDFIVRLIKN